METIRITRPRCCTVEAACDLHAAREACRQVRAFLAENDLAEDELDAWELALAEAANNAVQHAAGDARAKPIRFDVAVHEAYVEIRLTDHTPGFQLPSKAALPEADSESGRGLFLIQSLTDQAAYLRGAGENCFGLRKNRQPSGAAPAPPVNPQQELDEARRTLDLMTSELASAYESLATIFRFSAELHTGAPSEEFARRWLFQLLTITESDWFVLRLCDHDGNQLRVVATSSQGGGLEPLPLGAAAQSTSAELVAAARRVDVPFDPQTPLHPTDPLTTFGAPSCGFAHPLLVNEALVGVLTIGRRRSDRPFEAGQVGVIQTFADFLGLHIRNQHFQEQQARTRLLARDLEIAATIQRSLLPDRLPAVPGLALASFYRSAREVGGDYYDALVCGDSDLLLVVADVMGKGLPSALFSLMLRSLVRSRPDLAPKPADFLAWLNRNLFAELDRADMFITAQLVYVDRRHYELRVSSAGHPPMLLADASGAVVEINVGGLPLGLAANETFPEIRRPWPAGRALMFTDGFIEARSGTGALLGLASVKAALADCARGGASCQATQTRLVALLHNFEQAGAPSDDTAFIVLAHELLP
jgi:serine phosphatase RsbU (regulator of sigma subunit)/anti-sigma regulatory factor (Ser/Thr protein kinase)